MNNTVLDTIAKKICRIGLNIATEKTEMVLLCGRSKAKRVTLEVEKKTITS